MSILLSLLLSTWTIYGIYGYLMSSFSRLADLISETSGLSGDVCDGDGAYVLVALLSSEGSKKIPMDVALKKCGVREL